jgi:hypothetical protein
MWANITPMFHGGGAVAPDLAEKEAKQHVLRMVLGREKDGRQAG